MRWYKKLDPENSNLNWEKQNEMRKKSDSVIR